MKIDIPMYNSSPAIVHAHGHTPIKPHWPPIRDAYFASPARQCPTPENLTIITCNNGHPAMGCFERSLSHMGAQCVILGEGIKDWVNSRDKPRLIAQAAREAKTEFLMYADSRDAILVRPPATVIEKYLSHFDAGLLFGADRLSWPPDRAQTRYEDQLGGDAQFRYLNAGAWIGRRSFVERFFAEAQQCAPVSSAADSEQGVVRQLLPKWKDQVAMDYRCEIFFNIGYLLNPVPIYQINLSMETA